MESGIYACFLHTFAGAGLAGLAELAEFAGLAELAGLAGLAGADADCRRALERMRGWRVSTCGILRWRG